MSEAAQEVSKSLSARTWTGRLAVWPACALAMTIHLAFAHDDYTVACRLAAGGLCCLAMICTAFAPVRVLPAVAIGVGYLYLALGTPIFSRGSTHALAGTIYLPRRALEEATLASLCYAAAAAVVALVVDRLSRRLAWRVTFAVDGRHRPNSADTWIARTVAFASIGLKVAIVAQVEFGSLKNPVTMFASVVIPLTLLYWDAERRDSPPARTLFWCAVGFLCLVGLLTGMVQDALMPVMITATLMWAHRSRLPFTLFGICFVALVFLTPVKHIYRQLAWGQTQPTLLERINLWGVAIDYAYGGTRDEEQQLHNSVEGARSRAGTLGSVAHIFEAVPSRIPFAGAERWLMLPTLAIPRVLWKEKPILDTYFNRNYTYTFRIQTRTSGGTHNLPSVGDGYWRLGWPGVFLEAAGLGILLGIAQAISRGGTRSALLLAAAMMQVRPDMHVAGSLLGTLQMALVAALVAVGIRVLSEVLSVGSEPSGVERGAVPRTT